MNIVLVNPQNKRNVGGIKQQANISILGRTQVTNHLDTSDLPLVHENCSCILF